MPPCATTTTLPSGWRAQDRARSRRSHAARKSREPLAAGRAAPHRLLVRGRAAASRASSRDDLLERLALPLADDGLDQLVVDTSTVARRWPRRTAPRSRGSAGAWSSTRPPAPAISARRRPSSSAWSPPSVAPAAGPTARRARVCVISVGVEVRAAVPDQEQDARLGTGSPARRLPARGACHAPRERLDVLAAPDAAGRERGERLGERARGSRYVITRRLSHPMISAHSATPARAGRPRPSA